MGWGRAQFYALDDEEQDFWRAWDLRRTLRLTELLESMQDVESFDRLAATVMVLLEQ